MSAEFPEKPERTYKPLPLGAVVISGGFMKLRQDINAEKTIYAVYDRSKETGRIDAFRLEWKPDRKDIPKPHYFWDSDVAKWVEAAAYSLRHHPDPKLKAKLDGVVDLIISAQQSDGYLNVYFTVVEPEMRWKNLREKHELYCAGHLMEAAVALKQSLNDSRLLNAMIKYADLIDSKFGRAPGKIRGYPGHQEIELALVRMYHLTGNRRYLELAEYFVNERGQDPYYFDIERQRLGIAVPDRSYLLKGEIPRGADFINIQAHLPAREQDEAVGHAVRACYFYSAMADIAMEYGDSELMDACKSLWEDIAYRKMYITGGLGSSSINEGFTYPYDLPNETAYAETCAGIAWFLFNFRMLQAEAHRKYADMMERALYNGILSGVSLEGDTFFYTNPLEINESGGIPPGRRKEKRLNWRVKFFDCSCCPPNIARLIASLDYYMYTVESSFDKDKFTENPDGPDRLESVKNVPKVYVNLYGSSEAIVDLGNNSRVKIEQITDYPWSGKIHLKIKSPESSAAGQGQIVNGDLSVPEFTLALRIPGWCDNFTLSLNAEEISKGPADLSESGNGASVIGENGYVFITNDWKDGDEVVLSLDMVPKKIFANPKVEDDLGKMALMRGPIVYCFEEIDNESANFKEVFAYKEGEIEEIPYGSDDFPEGLKREKGMVCLRIEGVMMNGVFDGEKSLYTDEVFDKKISLLAIPYYAWANRRPGNMSVWIKWR